MAKEIKINEEAVRDIQKALFNVSEQINDLRNSISRTIDMAENEGWSDESYFRFKDNFMNFEKYLSDAIIYEEDILQPELKRLIDIIEGY